MCKKEVGKWVVGLQEEIEHKMILMHCGFEVREEGGG